MTKQEALRVLIEQSFLLSYHDRDILLKNLSSFSEEEVEAWGRVLAIEKKESIEASEEILKKIDVILSTNPPVK